MKIYGCDVQVKIVRTKKNRQRVCAGFAHGTSFGATIIVVFTSELHSCADRNVREVNLQQKIHLTIQRYISSPTKSPSISYDKYALDSKAIAVKRV